MILNLRVDSANKSTTVPPQFLQKDQLSDLTLLPLGQIPVVLAITIGTLNSAGSLSFFVNPTLKLVLGVVSLAFAAHAARRLVSRPRLIRSVLPWTAYIAVLLASYLVWDTALPEKRGQLFALFLVTTIAMATAALSAPLAGLRVVMWIGILHIFIAVVFPTRILWFDGRIRLSGGSHPLQLGFESSLVALMLMVIAASSTSVLKKCICFAGALVSAWVMLQTEARQALISGVIGVVLIFVLVPGRWRSTRVALIILLAMGCIVLVPLTFLLNTLQVNSVQEIIAATGRTDRWKAILDVLPSKQYLGYGLYAINDADGPDSFIYGASDGFPAENSVIQVLLDGGIIGLVVWSAAMLTTVTRVLRAQSTLRPLLLVLLPGVVVSGYATSGLSGEGIPWYWLLAVAIAPCVTTSANSWPDSPGATSGNFVLTQSTAVRWD